MSTQSASYGPLLAGYTAMVTALAAAARRFGPPRAPRPEPIDVVLIGLGTFKLSRLVAKEKVLEPVRAPFVAEAVPGQGSEVNSKPDGSGVRRAVGELLTCPFCVSVWIATVFIAVFAIAPRAVRFVTSGLAAVVVADTSQYAYTGIRDRTS
jgi:hypothetical protein